MGYRKNGYISVSRDLLFSVALTDDQISIHFCLLLFSFREMLSAIREKYPDFHALPNDPNDTSKAYKVDGFKGQVGFITSMTEHFCGSCNRLRITADGNLKVCLFGNKEVSLKDAIRANCSEDDLRTLIESAVKRKHKQHAGKN